MQTHYYPLDSVGCVPKNSPVINLTPANRSCRTRRPHFPRPELDRNTLLPIAILYFDPLFNYVV